MHRSGLAPRLPSGRQRGEVMRRTSVVEGGWRGQNKRAACKQLVLDKIKTRRAALKPSLD
jgi:hypothetical protein